MVTVVFALFGSARRCTSPELDDEERKFPHPEANAPVVDQGRQPPWLCEPPLPNVTAAPPALSAPAAELGPTSSTGSAWDAEHPMNSSASTAKDRRREEVLLCMIPTCHVSSERMSKFNRFFVSVFVRPRRS